MPSVAEVEVLADDEAIASVVSLSPFEIEVALENVATIGEIPPVEMVEVSLIGSVKVPSLYPTRTIVTTGLTTITVGSADHGCFVRLTAATAVTIYLPAGVAVGTQVEFQATSTGLGTFVLSGGAAWGPAPVPSAVMLDTGSACTAICVAANTWTVVGRLA